MSERLIGCTCSGEQDLSKLRKQVGELVNPEGNLVRQFSELKEGAVYELAVDGAAIQSSVVNLIGNSVSFARSAELQVKCLSFTLSF